MKDSSLTYALKLKIFDTYLGLPERDWSTELHQIIDGVMQQFETAEQAVAAAQVQDTKPSLPLSEYTGIYSHQMYGDLQITFEDGRLTLPGMMPGEPASELLHWHYDTFLLHSPIPDPLAPKYIFLVFSLDAMGQVKDMELKDPLDMIQFGTFERIDNSRDF